MIHAPGKVIKEYPPRGPMQQFRLDAATAFHCFRCGQDKKSKLITAYASDFSKLLCNGCYGFLLSIFTIKKGAGTDEEKAEALADVLLACISNDQQEEAARRLIISERRASVLSQRALKFIATSDYVAENLTHGENLDWSPAVIGLCKSFENEAIIRLIDPLKALSPADLAEDAKDKDFGRVAKYCAGAPASPPELGTIRYFLQTAAHSATRSGTSTLLRGLKSLVAQWPRSTWLFRDEGLLGVLDSLVKRFRNRAAHIEELTKEEYNECRQLVVGPDGVLWMLVLSTQTGKESAASRK